MKKLRLNLENLSVESFDTGHAERRRGTVYGHISLQTCDLTCDGGTFLPQMTCSIYCSPESVGLSACCYSQECTGARNDFQCINSQNYCFETQQEGCSFFC